jgi:DNA-binding NarL/FixJ family response regulator
MTSSTLSWAAPRRALRILLIEDDLLDAVWIAEFIKAKSPTSEVVHKRSMADAQSFLAQSRIDAIFMAVHPDDEGVSIHTCREIVRRARQRPVVALINTAEKACAAEIRAAGVKLIYYKHPIWRTALIRKQQLREKFVPNEEEAGRQQ